MRPNSLGSALPITLMTPTAPKVINGNVMPSSPEMTSKWDGLFLMISSICVKLPLASLIATMFMQSFARRRVVSAVMFTPTRPGTLYSTTGSVVALAIALKC